MHDTEYTEIDAAEATAETADEKQPPRGARSVPWQFRDMIRVTKDRTAFDLLCVYRLEKPKGETTRRLMVKLPGGKSETVERLRELGFGVRVPLMIRTEDYA